MVPSKEKQAKIDEFVKRIREAAGPNMESIILFGSAVAGDFHPGKRLGRRPVRIAHGLL